jgi:hypothetical protein
VKPGTLKRWRALLERLGDRLGKSSRVFVIGLFVACGIEVAVDWNSTLEEINVLRASMRQKAEDYVDILRRAAQPAVEAYDWDALDELSRGLLDDEDVVYVRFTDALGNTLHDRVRDDFAAAFARAQRAAFRDRYRHQMDRDIAGMMTDPTLLRARIAQSRHRDFIQGFTDFERQLLARFSPPPPPHEPPPQVLYQDRLHDDARQLDRTLSYALGVITNERGDPTGVALLALRHDRLNRAVASKLFKGLAITLFFVTLILVQNVLARRAKLRLLDLEQALSAARAAVRAATPETPVYGPGQLGIAFAQADRLGGTVYDVSARADGSLDLLLAVPEGAGVDAAFASVVLRDVYRWQHAIDDPGERVARVAADYDASPLARDIELLCAHFDADGSVRGVVSGLRAPACIDVDGVVRALPLGDPLPLQARRLNAPLRPFAFSLADGALAIFDDGMPAHAPRRLTIDDVLARMADRLRRRHHDAQSVAEEAVAEAVQRYRQRHSDDFFALVVTRSTRA